MRASHKKLTQQHIHMMLFQLWQDSHLVQGACIYGRYLASLMASLCSEHGSSQGSECSPQYTQLFLMPSECTPLIRHEMLSHHQSDDLLPLLGMYIQYLNGESECILKFVKSLSSNCIFSKHTWHHLRYLVCKLLIVVSRDNLPSSRWNRRGFEWSCVHPTVLQFLDFSCKIGPIHINNCHSFPLCFPDSTLCIPGKSNMLCISSYFYPKNILLPFYKLSLSAGRWKLYITT